ncbi:MAG: YqeG family HAD IIIA-type phosphatase [Coriobacteriales bacterium]|jgi:HAD superfamily phosphatase (TIGR01668 family)|nr:YqeG family HAD IIIA-type phosphatase [Coriobacteriales bacterium]
MALLVPEWFFSRVEVIDAAELAGLGVKTVILDIDNTLVPRGTSGIPPSVSDWVQGLKTAGMRICLVSNNWHRVVFSYARQLDVPLVYKAMKPAPFSFLRAIRKAEGRRASTLVIGDQLFTDVLGAHLLGMRAVLVLPQVSQDLRHTLLLRRLEQRFMRGLAPTR